MNRNEIENIIIKEKYPELRKPNLDMLLKEHLEAIIADEKVIISVERLVKIFVERNEKADKNIELNQERFGLKRKLENLTDWSKSELINVFKRKFGKFTEEDNAAIASIGAISIKTANRKIQEKKQEANMAIRIARQIGESFRREYENRRSF